MKAKLGSKVRDKITGFVGIIFAKTDYLNGCCRIGMQAKINEKNIVPDPIWVDEIQIELIEEDAFIIKPSDKGGPAAIPINRHDPKY